jgi:hypothetical protein
MATLGQPLVTPESSWRRIDDTLIENTGTGWTKTTNAACWGGSIIEKQTPTAADTFKFTFLGTKIRLIDYKTASRGNRAITIDGVTEIYNCANSSQITQALVYEKLDLQFGYHDVTISSVSGGWFSLDAIDIDTDAKLFPFGYRVNKILLSSGDKNYRLERIVSRENAVPVMTSASHPNVEITASAYNASDYPWYAFDGIVNATVRPFWFTNSTPPAGGHWLQVKFVKPKTITGISLASLLVTGSSHSIKEFELYGSNDGVVYEKLYTNTQPNVGTRIYYDFESSKAYLYYRLNILSSYNLVSTVGVNEMEIFQKKNQIMYVLDTSDEIGFIQYGMEGEIPFNGAVDKVKDIIKMNLPLASGKAFEHTIDMSKRRVDKVTLG